MQENQEIEVTPDELDQQRPADPLEEAPPDPEQPAASGETVIRTAGAEADEADLVEQHQELPEGEEERS